MSIQEYEKKIKTLKDQINSVRSELTRIKIQGGKLLAIDNTYSDLSGWRAAHELSDEINLTQQRIELVEHQQDRYQKSQLELEKVEKILKHNEQKHRIALLDLGKAAYHQFLLGSPSLSAHLELFAPLQELDEKIQQREKKQNDSTMSGQSPWMSRLRQGTSNLISRFQNVLDEGRKKSSLQEIGVEIVRLGLAQTVLAKQDPKLFEGFLNDLDSWENLFAQKIELQKTIQEIKGNPNETGYPFAVTLRDLKRLLSQLEGKSSTQYLELFQQWKDANYIPQPQGKLEEIKERSLQLEEELDKYQIDLEKAEQGLRGERLLEEARRNRERGQRLIEEGQDLINKAIQQEAEGQEFIARAQT
jgi:hypothetical protein